jgi:hypothetical protein
MTPKALDQSNSVLKNGSPLSNPPDAQRWPDLGIGKDMMKPKPPQDGRTRAARAARKPRPGPVTMFPGKIRSSPITITATLAHHLKVHDAMKRLGLTRAEVLGLLIELYADSLTNDHVKRRDKPE